MNRSLFLRRQSLASVIAATLALSITLGATQDPLSAASQVVRKAKVWSKSKPAAVKTRQRAGVAQMPLGVQRPTREVLLSKGEGQLVNLPAAVTNVWTSNPGVADVYVNNPRQLYTFGLADGEATIFATNASGAVVYSSNVRVSQNITSVDRMLKMAMPDANIKVINAGQMAVLTGTVATPEDADEARRLVTAYLNPGVDTSQPGASLKIGVVSRVRTATPLQVNLQVKIAEVSRSLIKEIGSNLTTRDTTGGFQFGVSQGRNIGSIGTANISGLPVLDASRIYGLPAGTISLPFDPVTQQFITSAGTAYNFSNLANGAKSAFGLAGHVLGLDILAALDAGENEGLVSTLAQPNLTALSGETASFLAGGEYPIPISQANGQVSVEFKQYGVSLAFTPTVLSDGRISMRVRPEVSELSVEGSVQLNGITVPGLTTRRTETTVELGSGQSFMIGGLMRNNQSNVIQKTPGAGDVPVLGALFRSSKYQKNETELVIVVTPYLVKPVSANEIALPTDGYKSASDLERVLLGQSVSSSAGGQRPKPTMAPPATITRPEFGNVVNPPVQQQSRSRPAKGQASAAAPGFSN